MYVLFGTFLFIPYHISIINRGYQISFIDFFLNINKVLMFSQKHSFISMSLFPMVYLGI